MNKKYFVIIKNGKLFFLTVLDRDERKPIIKMLKDLNKYTPDKYTYKMTDFIPNNFQIERWQRQNLDLS